MCGSQGHICTVVTVCNAISLCFIKQKTAYELRISDWSSDVCSSDLRAGTDGASNSAPLTAAEARAVLEEAFAVMSRARAQIRRPLDSRAQVTISIVDTHGSVLGIVRSPEDRKSVV